MTFPPLCALCEEPPVTVTADQISSQGNGESVTATGSVKIIRDDTTLKADSASFDRSDETATAEGHVIVERHGDILHGDKATLDYTTQKGLISNAFLEMRQKGMRVKSNIIEKVGDHEYLIDRGTLTMCEADPPSWKFTANDIQIDDDFASGKHVVFSVADIPVFYFPYLIVPTARERQSGFLLPRFGASTKKGAFLDIPYYINISPSQEATTYLELESKRGVGIGGEYRYLRPNQGSGSATGFMIYDLSQNRFRGTLSEKHQEYFTPTLSLKSSVELATDQNYFRDFSEASGDYNRQYLESNLFLNKTGEFWSLTPQIKYYYNLDTTGNTQTLQQLPTLSFNTINRPIIDPLFIALDSDFTYFYRVNGLQGQRARIAPKLSWYASPAPLLDINLWSGYQQAIYNAYDAPDTGGVFYGTVNTGASVSSTLTRVFQLNSGSLEKVRHVFIPELSYSYISTLQTTTPTFFDYSDKLLDQNMLFLSLANYLTGRFRTADNSSDYRELLYLRLSQGYDLRRQGIDLLTAGSDTRHFTDLRLEARVNPLQNMYIQTDTRVDVYDARFSSVDLTAGYRGTNSDNISLGYHYASNTWDYLEARFGVHLSDRFLLNYIGRYVIPGSKFLENTTSLEYRHQCWGVSLAYQSRQNDTQVVVNFTLAGIGSYGTKAF